MTDRRMPEEEQVLRMEYTEQQLITIFNKTHGICHICQGKKGPELVFSNYGNKVVTNGWEVEYLNLKDGQGTDNPDNWWPAHIECNSRKGSKKTRKVRRTHELPRGHLVPSQDMDIERWQAELRGRAGL